MEKMIDQLEGDDDQDVDVMHMITKLATERVDEGKEKARQEAEKKFWRKLAVFGLIGITLLLIAVFGLMLFAITLMKEARAVDMAGGYSEMTSHSGNRIRCASADIEVDENGALKGLGGSGTIGIRLRC